jgi:hypothetical protein
VNPVVLLSMPTLYVGCKVIIKSEAWKKYLEFNKMDSDKPDPGPREVAIMPAHNEAVMLDFPYYWWHESDLELAP